MTEAPEALPEPQEPDTVEEKKWLRSILTKIVSGLFDTKVLLAITVLMGGAGTYKLMDTSDKVDQATEKQEVTAVRDSSYKNEQRAWRSRIEIKIDSILLELRK